MKLYHSAGDKDARITLRVCGTAFETAKNNEIYKFVVIGSLVGVIIARAIGMKMPPFISAALAVLAIICFGRLMYYLFQWSSLTFTVRENMGLNIQVSPTQIMFEAKDHEDMMVLFKNGYRVDKLKLDNEVGYICTGRGTSRFAKIFADISGKTIWCAGRMQVMIVPDPNQHREAIAILEHIYQHKSAKKLIKNICKECEEENK